MSQQTPHVINAAVFMPASVQLLDMASVDLLRIMSHEYLSELELPMVPKGLLAAAPSVRISFVTTKANMEAGRVGTTSVAIVPTHDLAHPDMQPGKLDMVLVPGPDPSIEFSAEVTGWLRAQMESEGTEVLSICTGMYVCGQSGIVDGKRACGPKFLQEDLRRKWPRAEFVGEALRWERDGRFWSCGGVTNGNDLIAAWARHSSHIPTELAELAIKMSEIADRPQEYSEAEKQFVLV